MSAPLTFGSLFAGVGGFDLGLERAGMVCRWQVEIDPACRRVLARHWPQVERHEDVREVGRANLAPVDLVCGGFPCQDISVAGRRAGLAGERSGLFHEAMRVVAELAPRWVLLENVPGLLSSNGGRDMGTVLGRMGELGYGWAYRVLDAQHFGVAQRRRRVFIVGCLGDPAGAAAVLLEPESVCGDPPPRRAARPGAAGGAGSGAADGGGAGSGVSALTRSMVGGGGGADDNAAQAGHIILAQNGSDVQVSDTPGAVTAGQARQTSGDLIVESDPGGERRLAAALTSRIGKGAFTDPHNDNIVVAPQVAATVRASDGHHGHSSPRGDGCDNQVVAPQADEPLPFDTTQITSAANRSNPQPGSPCHTLAGAGDAPAVAFLHCNKGRPDGRQSQHTEMVTVETETVPTLATDGHQQSAIAFHHRASASQSMNPSEICPALDCAKEPAVAVAQNQRGELRTMPVAPALTDGGGKPGEGYSAALVPGYGVRRLLPVECERLQGFPDSWTATDAEGKPLADSPRYRMLGNAVCVPVAEWIARRIVAAERGEL